MSESKAVTQQPMWTHARQRLAWKLLTLARRLAGNDTPDNGAASVEAGEVPSADQSILRFPPFPNAKPAPVRLPVAPASPVTIAEGGRVAYEPINVNATYHNGHLYYPIETLVQVPVEQDDGKVMVQEQTEVVVVRSDRTVHRAHASQVPDEASSRQQVYRLSDGTLIQRPPKANPHGTWSFEAAAAYLHGAGEELDLGALARSVHQHLYSRIWLPDSDDYWLLTYIAIVSYVQSVFDAVPLCLVVGPAGSGKSELGATMAQVSANSVMIGQTSPATMMRLIDESGGLVVIDDLEAIGSRGRGRKEERFSEIAQVIKVSYKKSTATKVVTDSKTMKTQVLNFFGCKILNNTTGSSGPTLGSRMVRVQTRHLPPQEKTAFLARRKIPETELAALRNALHTWAMSHVATVRQAYLESVVDRTLREEEIAAPLRTVAKLAGDQSAAAALERALNKDDSTDVDPHESLKRIVERLARDGYRSVSLQHLLLELRRMMADADQLPPPWLKLEWIGRQLRQMAVTTEHPQRKRLHGTHLRIASLDPAWLSDVVRRHGQLAPPRDPFDFCDQCESCRFSDVSCEVAVKRRLGPMSAKQ